MIKRIKRMLSEGRVMGRMWRCWGRRVWSIWNCWWRGWGCWRLVWWSWTCRRGYRARWSKRFDRWCMLEECWCCWFWKNFYLGDVVVVKDCLEIWRSVGCWTKIERWTRKSFLRVWWNSCEWWRCLNWWRNKYWWCVSVVEFLWLGMIILKSFFLRWRFL